ncbi:MAG: hypothetical protein ACXWID_01610 [Pyrinomonadaceae bacterium]
MRLLIIVTDCETYSLLDDKTGWDPNAQTESWTRAVGDDQVAVVAQFSFPLDPAESGKKRRDRILTGTTERLIGFANARQEQTVAAYLAFHDGYVDVAKLSSAVNLDLAGAAPFNHEPDDSEEFVYPALCELVNSPSANAFDAAVEVVMAKQGVTAAQRLASLRYRLLRLFAPIEMDLATWHDTNFDDQYLAKIIASYAKAEQRLVLARELFYNAEVPAESLESVIQETGLTEQAAWQAAQALLPRQTNPQPGDEVQNDLFAQVFLRANLLATLRDPQKMAELAKNFESSQLLSKWCQELGGTLTQLAAELTTHETRRTVPGPAH